MRFDDVKLLEPVVSVANSPITFHVFGPVVMLTLALDGLQG